MSNKTKVLWSFIVDTKDYAGNFERELCAYVCGKVDEYANVDTYLDLYEKECPKNPFDYLVESRINDPGDDGIMRAPMDIVETPLSKGEYNSVRIFLAKKPTIKQFDLLVDRVKKFCSLPTLKECQTRPTLIRCRLVTEVTVSTTVKTS